MGKNTFWHSSFAKMLPIGVAIVLSTSITFAEETNILMNLKCEVSCSQTKLRTGIATITWTTPVKFEELSPQHSGVSRTAISLSPILDTAVHKNGFKENTYISLSPLDPQPKAYDSGSGGASNLPPHIKRAFDLQIANVKTIPKPGVSFSDTVVPKTKSSPGTSHVIEIENIEPGLNYIWRVRFETATGSHISETVLCQAPICPADIKEDLQP